MQATAFKRACVTITAAAGPTTAGIPTGSSTSSNTSSSTSSSIHAREIPAAIGSTRILVVDQY